MVAIGSSTPLPLLAPRETSAPSRSSDTEHTDFSSELAAADQRAETPESPRTPARRSGAGQKTRSDASGKTSGARTPRTETRKQDGSEDAKNQEKDGRPVAVVVEEPVAEPVKTVAGPALGTTEPKNAEEADQPALADTLRVAAGDSKPATAATPPAAIPAATPVATQAPSGRSPRIAVLTGVNVETARVGDSDAGSAKLPPAAPAASDPVADLGKPVAPKVAPQAGEMQPAHVAKPAAASVPVAASKSRSFKTDEADPKSRTAAAPPSATPSVTPQLRSEPSVNAQPQAVSPECTSRIDRTPNVQSPVASAADAVVTGSPTIDTGVREASKASALAFAVTFSDRRSDAATQGAKPQAGFSSELPAAPKACSTEPVTAAASKNTQVVFAAAAAAKPLPGLSSAPDRSGVRTNAAVVSTESAGSVSALKASAAPRPETLETPEPAAHGNSDASGKRGATDAHSEHAAVNNSATPQPAAAPPPAASPAAQPAASATPAAAGAESGVKPDTSAVQDVPATPAAHRPSEPLRDISVRIASDGDSRVDVRLTDRAGELRIEVRTPDEHLTKSLRDGLPELAERLETSGRTNQVWRPADSGASLSDQGSREPRGQSLNSESQNNPRHNNSQSGNEGGRRGRQNQQDGPAGRPEEAFAAYLRQGRGNL